ncbi:hypothetical protein JCGZ_22981 [Jatropha curcas]|uniref:Uncharacterized protein n=1 Tax=Jatropha curcas TaxID=180498 RepID=A0A067K0X7_JATCU|nr:hypothetical protein JCGZ_22981 [Jatropha curcas]
MFLHRLSLTLLLRQRSLIGIRAMPQLSSSSAISIVRRVSDSEASDMVVVIDKLEHSPATILYYFVPSLIGCPCLILQVSVADNNEVCQLYEVARLKLVVVRLSNEHVSLAWRLQWAEVGDFRAVCVLIEELNVGRLSLKRPRSLVATTRRRRLPMHLELAALVYFLLFLLFSVLRTQFRE